LDGTIYTLTGGNLTILRGYNNDTSSANYTITGQDVTFTYTPINLTTYSLFLSSGGYILTGTNDPVLSRGYTLILGAGTYNLTGDELVTTRGINLALGTAIYNLLGSTGINRTKLMWNSIEGNASGEAQIYMTRYARTTRANR